MGLKIGKWLKKRKKRRQDRRTRRQTKRKKAFVDLGKGIKKGFHAIKKEAATDVKAAFKEVKKLPLKDIGSAAEAGFQEVKDDVIDPALNMIQAPANFMNKFGDSVQKGPSITTVLMVGGVAVVAVMAMR